MRILPVLLLALAACSALPEREGPARKETVIGVTEDNRLVRFNAGQPQRIQSSVEIAGLLPGEIVLGIDYRVARGVLYALGNSSRLYTIDPKSGRALAVGGAFDTRLQGNDFGFDFNPTVDRIRVVSDAGQNMRLHPDTGALVQADAPLAYAAGDVNAGKKPQLVAAAYTYNKADAKLTTNFAIDGALGVLVTQGSREGRSPAVSPNTGQLFTVGRLGTGPVSRVSFDISDTDNAAFVAAGARFYSVNLATGAATFIGTLPEALRGIAIEP